MARKAKVKVSAAVTKIPTNPKKDDYDDMIPGQIGINIAKADSATQLDDPIDYEPETKAFTISEDGTLIESTGEDALEEVNNPEFFDNLAETLEFSLLDDIAADLLEKYEQDREDRKRRDEQYDEGLKRSGLEDSASPGGANFEGASRVVHPMISESCVNFAAKQIKELFPASGPVKSHIVGTSTSKKINEGERKREFLNVLTTNLMPFRPVLETTLSQLPLGGSQFIKFWHDEYFNRPNCEFLPIDNVYIPYACNDFYTAERVSIYMELGHVEFDRRVDSGLYYERNPDNDLGTGESNLEYQSQTSITNDKIEGKRNNSDFSTNDARQIIECYTYLKISEDEYSNGKYAPYIATIDIVMQEIVALYRNWSLTDEKMHKLDYIVEWKFIPWRGAYAIGLPQLIGGLSKAATGALRALLDSAHINNLPVALGLKGIKMGGQSPDIQIGSITPIEGPSGLTEDINKCIMRLPFNPPSQTLYSLLEWVTNAASGVIKSPDGFMDKMDSNMKATTAMAGIEQSGSTESAIHARLHYSMAKCLEIICRLIKDHFNEDGYPSWLLDDLKINQGLFDHTRDIRPVSDPNIFTEAQRYKQYEAACDLQQRFPQYINSVELVKRGLQLLKMPNPDLLLNVPNAVTRSNQVAENMAACMGTPIQAYPDQDHLAHIQILIQFLSDPLYGSNPLFNQAIPILVKHLGEHLTYYYSQTYQNALNIQLEHTDGEIPKITQEDTPEKTIDNLLLQLSPDVMQTLQQTLGPLMSHGQQIVAKYEQMMQQQAQNPEMMKVQVAQQKVQNDAKKDQLDAQNKQAEIQVEQSQVKAQELRSQIELEIERLKAQTQIATGEDQNHAKALDSILKHVNDMEKLSQQKVEHQTDLHHRAMELGQKDFEHVSNHMHERSLHNNTIKH